MRLMISLLVLFSWNYVLFGQINVGSNEAIRKKPGNLKASTLQDLKNSKTIFVYRNADKQDLGIWEDAILNAWEYSKIDLMPYDEFVSRPFDESYSFFTIGGYHSVYTMSSGTEVENTYIYLNLWKSIDGEKSNFARIELYPTFETYEKATEYGKKDADLMIKYLYEEATLHNWQPGFLKNALQFVNEKLSKSQEYELFESDVFRGIRSLARDTLFIPDYALIKFGAFTGDESQHHDIEDLTDKYPYPYKVISTQELSDRILYSEDPVYYVHYVKSSARKFFTIVNGKSGEFLYAEYRKFAYNVKSKDFKQLAKAIKKGK